MLLVSMIISGACNTIVYKLQNSFEVAPGQKFNHPFMQSVTMFFGEFICIFMFLYMKKFKREQIEEEKRQAQLKGLNTKMNYFLLAIPAFADFLTSILHYIALNYMAPSLYQMLRGGVILVTALFSVVFLKRKIYLHNYIGCGLVIIGITLVGSVNYIFPKSSNSDDVDPTMALIAIILILISLFTNGILFVSEEKLFSKYYLHPMQVVGTEGIWGLCFYAILLPILALVPCSKDSLKDLCMEYNGSYHIENPVQYFQQFADFPLLGFYIVLGVFTIACFNVCGVSITKHISSLARSVVDVTRTVAVWIVAIIITLTAGQDNKNYQWENVNVGPIIVEAIGFIILVTGNLIYNKLIVLPFAKSQTYLEERLTKEENFNKSTIFVNQESNRTSQDNN
ncbi:nucleotide-sugar transporter (macronuclear) [Tetrahymena thermophila SB210]|uniref:Nucleotide-sugar transporter n=1 Tax=Tetrahymena thermophila (strain SB210) TaxID=312017 RepID=Q22Z10_TETTS|nr:nucleotide-sugar transporter [Tetrahymena thermophila SB210]EAR90511.2 nucleotide-sugar transporter [Tetrahymena thermophila SB210]|eukprot:XP_001010756.2 nucleotide-sugar transporter [Tetrahymena thermophila SB210]